MAAKDYYIILSKVATGNDYYLEPAFYNECDKSRSSGAQVGPHL